MNRKGRKKYADVEKMLQTWRNAPQNLYNLTQKTWRAKHTPADIVVPNLSAYQIIELDAISDTVIDAHVILFFEETKRRARIRFVAETAPYQPAARRRFLGIFSRRNEFLFNPNSIRYVQPE